MTDAVVIHAPGVVLDDIRAACGDPGHLLGVAARSPETLSTYLASGGYGSLPASSDLHRTVERAALDGRGGAGFPMARKLAAVADADGPRIAVANGEEGEPASVKDRWLLRHRPHLILDGLRVAATIIDADELFVLVSDPLAAASVATAIEELSQVPGWTVPVPTLVTVDAAYVAGEETAVVRAIDGGEAKPTLKPPRPYEVGVHGRPTLVANVESLARLAHTADPAVGTAAGASVLSTVIDESGASLLEVPATTTIGELLTARRGAGAAEPIAVILGGFAGGIWPITVLALPLDRRVLRERGVILGCGSVIAVEPGDCVVAAATDVASYLAASSSGQCGICVRGTAVVAENLTDLAHGTATPELLTQLARRVSMIRGRGNCAMPDAVEVMVRTLLEHFPDEVAAHVAAPCPTCRELVPERPGTATRFRVELAPGLSA